MSGQCINLEVQHRILLAAMKAGKEGKPLALPEDLEKHVATCLHCGLELRSWITVFGAMKRLTEETELMERGFSGDPTVLRRHVKEGLALFQPADVEGGLGLMVIVGDRSPYDARRTARMTRAQFEELDKQFSEYEIVKLKRPQADLPAGVTGTVVMVYNSVPPGYDVEFVDEKGETLAVLTLRDEDLEATDMGKRGTA